MRLYFTPILNIRAQFTMDGNENKYRKVFKKLKKYIIEDNVCVNCSNTGCDCYKKDPVSEALDMGINTSLEEAHNQLLILCWSFRAPDL